MVSEEERPHFESLPFASKGAGARLVDRRANGTQFVVTRDARPRTSDVGILLRPPVWPVALLALALLAAWLIRRRDGLPKLAVTAALVLALSVDAQVLQSFL